MSNRIYEIANRNLLVCDLDDMHSASSPHGLRKGRLSGRIQAMVDSNYCLEALATEISRAAGVLPLDSPQRGRLDEAILILLQLQRDYKLVKR